MIALMAARGTRATRDGLGAGGGLNSSRRDVCAPPRPPRAFEWKDPCISAPSLPPHLEQWEKEKEKDRRIADYKGARAMHIPIPRPMRPATQR